MTFFKTIAKDRSHLLHEYLRVGRVGDTAEYLCSLIKKRNNQGGDVKKLFESLMS